MTETPIHIEISIEELHLHNPTVQAETSGEDPIDISTETPFDEDESGSDDTPDGFGEGAMGPRPGGYDIRDRPASGLALLTIADSDGATSSAIADIHDLKRGTVTNALRKLHNRYALEREERNNKVFYRITEFGERVLSDYKERWRDGYRNLPTGYWNGVATRSDPETEPPRSVA